MWKDSQHIELMVAEHISVDNYHLLGLLFADCYYLMAISGRTLEDTWMRVLASIRTQVSPEDRTPGVNVVRKNIKIERFSEIQRLKEAGKAAARVAMSRKVRKHASGRRVIWSLTFLFIFPNLLCCIHRRISASLLAF